jgi:hypothetical protein
MRKIHVWDVLARDQAIHNPGHGAFTSSANMGMAAPVSSFGKTATLDGQAFGLEVPEAQGLK